MKGNLLLNYNLYLFCTILIVVYTNEDIERSFNHRILRIKNFIYLKLCLLRNEF